ncbi:TetR family transcriptional regulator [Natronomonas salina]|uniref:TetR family transcriptional regulator C-terminal domain-containing protein n=1 Tax=Natronomonas salina TaxID=1710540 RepID=UPI0015B3CE15|nr:TetR/AcrR family transcriptional regulator [Natronomonas salina]QLD89038.1 TetR family transcriptional regulator [Natronomonas salina]
MADSPERSFSGPDEEIMQATYQALQDHGYAGLTIKRIAEEYGKSTAAIHYHYETKEDLLAAFIEFVLARFKETIHEVETTDPERRLDLLLDKLLVAPADHQDLLVAMLEMRSQAPYNETFRDRFRKNDEYVRYMLRTVIEQGVQEDVFRDVDADHVARALLTIVDGARTRAVVPGDDEALDTARRTAEEYVESVLLDEPPTDD